MIYITPTELLEYKIGFDLSGYTETELLVYIEIAQSLINDYIGYSIDYNPVIDEVGHGVIQRDQKLFITLKSRNIDTITALSLNTYGGEYINQSLTYINLFKKAGYFYLTFTADFYAVYLRPVNPGKIDYKVSYTKEDKGIPSVIKIAAVKIVGNLLRADYNFRNGVAGTDGTIQSFTSGDYSVKLSGSTLAYKGVGSNGGNINNIYIDDGVKSLLYKLKTTGQNTY